MHDWERLSHVRWDCKYHVVTGIEGKKLTYHIEVHDSVEKVAEGTHTRFIVDSKKFFANLEKKKHRLGLP